MTRDVPSDGLEEVQLWSRIDNASTVMGRLVVLCEFG